MSDAADGYPNAAARATRRAAYDFLHDDITTRVEEDALQDQQYTAEQVKDWLNVLNGEGPGGGPVSAILSDRWTEADVSDPRD